MSASRTIRGFTLVELMITIAVMAIGLALAYPSFSSVFRSNRVATRTNTLIASLNLARTEAIRSNRGAGVCSSADGSSCNGANWDAGWLVFTDMDADGQMDADADTVVRYVEADANLSLASVEDVIVFDNRGRLDAEVTLTLESTDCPVNSELVRNLTLGRTGQIRMEKAPCTE
ncbi:GspH/FimT family pseudopilin [Lysobacter sp. F6437]|uniref:GspH/FimT family pseudopilin n=1 Tax=Lysobacter sp. F6437 TaxID=3459296 RepID=UPI00403E01A9